MKTVESQFTSGGDERRSALEVRHVATPTPLLGPRRDRRAGNAAFGSRTVADVDVPKDPTAGQSLSHGRSGLRLHSDESLAPRGTTAMALTRGTRGWRMRRSNGPLTRRRPRAKATRRRPIHVGLAIFGRPNGKFLVSHGHRCNFRSRLFVAITKVDRFKTRAIALGKFCERKKVFFVILYYKTVSFSFIDMSSRYSVSVSVHPI